MKKINTNGLVYSTNKELMQEEPQEEVATLIPEKQLLKIKLDTKQRAGKIVTLIEGFVGTQHDLETLAKTIKTHCGTGGTAKDGQIIIQGDYKQKVHAVLQKMNYNVK